MMASFNLLQTVRAAHAAAEVATVGVPPADLFKFDHLSQYFRLNYRPGSPPAIQVDHAAPTTRIGAFGRPLIIPRGIVERCREKWGRRDLEVTFCGLVTPERQRVLEPWVRRGARVIPSTAGRRWPGKGWDDNYHDTLARSRYVLCPDGDFTWSYRFFEAALCGAIPVVETACPLYDGFAFRMMADQHLPAWERGAAEHNARLAVGRLCPTADELLSQLHAGVAA